MSVIRTFAAAGAVVGVAGCAAAGGAPAAAGAPELGGRSFPAVGAAGVAHATVRLAANTALRGPQAALIRSILTLLAGRSPSPSARAVDRPWRSRRPPASARLARPHSRRRP